MNDAILPRIVLTLTAISLALGAVALLERSGGSWRDLGFLAAAIVGAVSYKALRLGRKEAAESLSRGLEQLDASVEQRVAQRIGARALATAITADLQKAESFAELASAFMGHLIPVLGAQYGALYVLDPEGNSLQRVGGYACEGKEGLRRSFALGEGLVGECAIDKAGIVLREVGDAKLRIAVGAGEITPRHLLLQALLQKDRVVGVLEFASQAPCSDEAKQLLAELMPLLAMNIAILERSLHTQALLEAKREEEQRAQRRQEPGQGTGA